MNGPPGKSVHIAILAGNLSPVNAEYNINTRIRHYLANPDRREIVQEMQGQAAYISGEGQECFPWKYWIVEKNKRPGRGEYAAFRGKGIPNFRDGMVWLKKIIGEERAFIAAREFAPSHTYLETVNLYGLPRDFQVRGQIHLYDREGKLVTGFEVFATDSRGKALPMTASVVIPARKYYVMATAKRSYD